ncbi:MAG: chemotaxis chemoreceptor PilJ [Wenzhouxiangellaceae bacterium]
MSAADPKRSQRRITPGTVVTIVLLIVLLVLAVANFYLLNESNRQQQQYLALTTNIQVVTQQLAKAAGEAAVGNFEAFQELAEARNTIESDLSDLRNGNDSTSLERSPPAVHDQLTTVEATWKRISDNARRIVEREQLVIDLSDSAQAFTSKNLLLRDRTDQAVQMLVRTGAPSPQVYIAGRQLATVESMLRRVGEILRGGMAAIPAADSFGRDAKLFERVLNGLINGDEELNLRAVRSEEALALLGEVQQDYNALREDIDNILSASTDLFEVRQAADDIFLDATDFGTQVQELALQYSRLDTGRLVPSLLAGAVLLALAVLAIIIFIISLFLDQRRRARETAEVNQRNQDAILRLLDEMSSLADGDLTVNATVTEDITGAIADSVNFAVEALRDLVGRINRTAQQVAAQAQEARATTTQLAEASEHQAREIRSATETINQMTIDFEGMAKQSSQSSEVAQQSVEIANRGATMVRQTISGMDAIREQIQETSKRIKRLGESSQEIGDIVELINGISEQTNILALNAAIQAASAGGAGRGFAVVADEVQRLAERATHATRRIETLVQTIQADTNEAVNSMEQTTTEVVRGARMAEDAGTALESIESVSNDLASLILEISQQASSHSMTATKVAQVMSAIRDISVQTLAGTNQTAESVNNLADMVRELRDSAADFKLPLES